MDPSISIILPVYNEEEIIGTTLKRIIDVCGDLDIEYEIIVIDDGSTDNSIQEINKYPVKVFCHPYNLGNGAAIKRGIRMANNEIIIMMDADGQHDPKYIKEFIQQMSRYDMVVGARSTGSTTAWHRNIANGVYNMIATYVCGKKIEDLTSGFRAVYAKVAKQFVYLLPNSFSYPSTLTISLVKSGYSLGYIPIKVNRRVGKSKINLIKDGMRFLVIILRITVFFAPLKVFLPISAFLFSSGMIWYIIQYLARQKLPQGSILLFLMGIVIFVLALVSEQISFIRYQNQN